MRSQRCRSQQASPMLFFRGVLNVGRSGRGPLKSSRLDPRSLLGEPLKALFWRLHEQDRLAEGQQPFFIHLR